MVTKASNEFVRECVKKFIYAGASRMGTIDYSVVKNQDGEVFDYVVEHDEVSSSGHYTDKSSITPSVDYTREVETTEMWVFRVDNETNAVKDSAEFWAGLTTRYPSETYRTEYREGKDA